MSMWGKGDLWPRLGNYPHYFGIAFTNSKSGPDAAIMRIIAASKKCGYSGPVPILRPNNADNIRIIEFVNGVWESDYCGGGGGGGGRKGYTTPGHIKDKMKIQSESDRIIWAISKINPVTCLLSLRTLKYLKPMDSFDTWRKWKLIYIFLLMQIFIA